MPKRLIGFPQILFPLLLRKQPISNIFWVLWHHFGKLSTQHILHESSWFMGPLFDFKFPRSWRNRCNMDWCPECHVSFLGRLWPTSGPLSYNRPWVFWHQRTLAEAGAGWTFSHLSVYMMCVSRRLPWWRVVSTPLLILPPVIFPKHCLLKNLQRFPSAYDRQRPSWVGTRILSLFPTLFMPLQGSLALATPSPLLWPKHSPYFLHWTEQWKS